jgi:hypothetical protein
MAWGEINGLLLVSGGLGMFDKETVIEAAGTIINRLVKIWTHYQDEKINASKKGKFLILYIPEPLVNRGSLPGMVNWFLKAKKSTTLLAAYENDN